jgi:hypothetical protein
MQAMAGNATWLGEFFPIHAGAARLVPETILLAFHLDGRCAAVAGEYATYMAGRIVTMPQVLALYAPFPHVNASTPSRETDVFFQIKRSAHFTLGRINFAYLEDQSAAGDRYLYVASLGDFSVVLRITCVESERPCGPYSNLNLVHFIWASKFYYLTNHAIFALPSDARRHRILYIRHRQAEMGGASSRACGHCAARADPRSLYELGCTRGGGGRCSCVACKKSPSSLRSAAGEFLFDSLHIADFGLTRLTTYGRYVYAAERIEAAGVPIERLVPFGSYPHLLGFAFVQFDEWPLDRYHEECSRAAVDRHVSFARHETSRSVESADEFVSLVTRHRWLFWCGHSDRPLFKVPAPIECRMLTL